MNDFARRAHRASLALAGFTGLALAILLIVLGAADGRGPQRAGSGDDGVALTPIGDFDSPVHVAFAPGETDKVYVVEQRGTVRVLVNGVEQPQPFLDLTDRTDESGERGLLSIAFHPDFASNGAVYAYYTRAEDGDIRVDEFATNSALDADESSGARVIGVRHRFAANHNGGQLAFGPNDRLFIGTGDGGGVADPRENGQDRRRLLGKLLRLSVDGQGGGYAVPSGNPLVGKPGRDEIYARGLRNPFRFSFDSATGRIAIGDVGENRFEEINYETPSSLRGANFGWDRWEGFKRFDGLGAEASGPGRKGHDRPIFAYSHSRGCSITGGFVVRDPDLPTLFGRYLYADFCDDELRSLVPKLSGATGDRTLGEQVPGVSSFGEDPVTRQIYVASLSGDVLRLDPDPE